MKFTRFVAISALAALGACATAPTNPAGQPVTLADAGRAPTDAPRLVREILRTRLKDAESARIELDRPARRVVFAKAAGANGGAGWEMCPNVNAKNSFGAYTGFQRHFILWRDGAVIDYIAGALGEAYCRDKNDFRLQVGQIADRATA